jgi:tetratricopeptide (TPR) repeat protein
LGYAYAVAGERDGARKLLEELKARSQKSYVPRFYIAGIYAGLGEKDQAMANLEKAYAQREQGLAVIKRAPMFDPLRADARFQGLLHRMNLPLEDPGVALAHN